MRERHPPPPQFCGLGGCPHPLRTSREGIQGISGRRWRQRTPGCSSVLICVVPLTADGSGKELTPVAHQKVLSTSGMHSFGSPGFLGTVEMRSRHSLQCHRPAPLPHHSCLGPGVRCVAQTGPKLSAVPGASSSAMLGLQASKLITPVPAP